MTKVRFAPSPTGELHLGSARTALYNYLFAKKAGGKFIFRLEDTDQNRYVAGSAKRLLDDLRWLGIEWDEGPDKKGTYGPYIQSQRLDIYKKHVDNLVAAGHAYYCFCSKDRLEKLRQDQQTAKQPTMYDRQCLNLTADQVKQFFADKTPYVVRLHVPVGTTEFTDLVHGKITIQNNTIDDQVLLKSDGFPTYHLANVVDDYLMQITHVIRGEEWLPSTAKHVLLYKAFGWSAPIWCHLPNVLNIKKSKLSKRRDGDTVWLSTYRRQGYLPPALVNYLALLGWHPTDEQEIFTLNDLTREFDLSRVQKAGAVFDITKLNWFNEQYIRKMSVADLDKELQVFYPKHSQDTTGFTSSIQSRLTKLSDVVEATDFFFKKQLKFEASLLIPKKGSPAKTLLALERALNIFTNVSNWTTESLRSAAESLVSTGEFSRGELLWPIRVALTGLANSPDVFDVMTALGKESSLGRLNQAINLLKKS